ncbi:MAG: maleylpyruvate isomerase N-terminal domain-containing protein [Acidimicrobiales bacterium]
MDRATSTDETAVASAVEARHLEVAEVLRRVDESVLLGESLLEGWSRLTIACHLRYGAEASRRMTTETLAGGATSFYPDGRDQQRPATLRPHDGESSTDVVESLREESEELDRLWRRLTPEQWQRTVNEPDDNPDLGPITLAQLALLRLTEVEVHGYDLDLGLSPWSITFVEAALPMRLHWLTTRRSNHRVPDLSIGGTWALSAIDGSTFLVRASEDATVEEATGTVAADATIIGTGSELLAHLLGRLALSSLRVEGDRGHAEAFLTAFPAP